MDLTLKKALTSPWLQRLKCRFWKAVKAGAQQALDDLNASLGYTGNDKVYMTFEGPENESDTNSQINIIDSVISENPDALILGIIDQQSGQAQMEEASDSQIPVVIADSGIESDLITSTCATDHAAAAKLAADHLCEGHRQQRRGCDCCTSVQHREQRRARGSI